MEKKEESACGGLLTRMPLSQPFCCSGEDLFLSNVLIEETMVRVRLSK
jgi:hypothetical protein